MKSESYKAEIRKKAAFSCELLLLLFVSILVFVASSFAESYIPSEPGIGNLKSIDSAVNWGNGKAYFFKGNQYIRYDIASDKADPGYPKSINQNNWPGFPWNDGITAAVTWGNGKAYFFKGNQYIRYDIASDKADSGYPKPINQSNWPGFPWNEIDAGINWGNGKAYFFKGNQYIRYDIASDKADSGYPKPINQSNWPGLPWDQIDTAANWGNGKAYFFKGNQYIRYDIKADKADPGYPKSINASNWPGLW